MNDNFERVVFLGRRFDDQFLSGSGYTFRAKVTHRNASTALDAFVKFFNPNTQKFGAANELVAYHLGHALKVPVAETFPCYCESVQLKGRVPWISADDTDAAHLCVASLCVAGSSFRARPILIPEFINRLLTWPHAPLAAIFDELIFNADRHQNNFLFIDNRDVVLIDHEQSFCGVNGNPSALATARIVPSPGNYIARVIMSSQSEITKRRLVEAAQDMAYRPHLRLDAIPDSLFDISGPLKISVNHIQTMLDFINIRKQKLPSLMQAQLSIETRLAARTS